MAEVRPLVGKQLVSYQLADAPGNLWEGAVRSSKTVCSILKWIEFIRQAPPGELCMIGKTERTLKRNVLDPMVAMLGTKRCKVSTGSGQAKILGRNVYLAGANDERAAEKIQGMTLIGWYGDEMSTWPESVFSIARTRLSLHGARWFGTSNPGASTHYLKRDVIDRSMLHLTRDGDLIRRYASDTMQVNVFSFQVSDNPTLDPGFVARLKREYTGIFYKRYILGEWCMAEGAILDMFDEKIHVVPRVPPIERWLTAGVDYGTTNPFHAVMIGIGPDLHHGHGKALYVTHEWRHDARKALRQMSPAEHSVALRAWMGAIPLAPPAPQPVGVTPESVCVDPSAAGFRVQLWRDGLSTLAANNDVLGGIATMSSLLANRKLFIVGPNCSELLAEIPGYAWDDRAAKLGEDKPVKVNDHGLDAGRYGLKTTESSWHDEIYGREVVNA